MEAVLIALNGHKQTTKRKSLLKKFSSSTHHSAKSWTTAFKALKSFIIQNIFTIQNIKDYVSDNNIKYIKIPWEQWDSLAGKGG